VTAASAAPDITGASFALSAVGGKCARGAADANRDVTIPFTSLESLFEENAGCAPVEAFVVCRIVGDGVVTTCAAEPRAAVEVLLDSPRSSTAVTNFDRAIAASAAALAFFAETKAVRAARAGAYAMDDAAFILARAAARSPAAVHAFAEPPCKYASSSNGLEKFITLSVTVGVVTT